MHGRANLRLSLAAFFYACTCEKGIVSCRLVRSVEFTARAEGALAYAWSVVPTVNPGVVWCSFFA